MISTYRNKITGGGLIERCGEITSAKITNYYKYVFHITLICKKKDEDEKEVNIRCGGNKDDIYRYNPLSTDWNEHLPIMSYLSIGDKIIIINDDIEEDYD